MSEGEEHLVFVYGTLKIGQPNNQYLCDEETGQAKFLGSGHTTHKYPLVIAGQYNIPQLLYVAGEGHHVEGDIYKVDGKKRDFLDYYESHPTFYERLEEEIVVTSSADQYKPKTLKCWTYFMKKCMPEMLNLERYRSYDSKGSHGLVLGESTGQSIAAKMSEGEEHLVFVYGTLKIGQPNNQYLCDEETGQAKFLGSGHTTHKYPLVIAGQYNIPYLLYTAGDGHHVEGDIYKVDSRKRDFLDDFESHPTYYERLEEEVVVTSSADHCQPKTLKCWTYFMKKYTPEMLNLERYSCYDSKGSHGLVYVESEETTDLSDL